MIYSIDVRTARIYKDGNEIQYDDIDFMKFLDDGGKVLDTVASKVTGRKVSMASARKALIDAGLYYSILQLAETWAEKEKVDWEYAQYVHSDNQALLGLINAGILTQAQVDQLFDIAEKY